jgi:septal ring factor EnvC (AmiA/AmiB activator)
VDAADKAVKTRDALAAQCTFFREIGNRKKLFDKVNAVRNLTYAALAKMPHDHVGLPRSFADLFFLHDSSGDDKPATIDSIDQELASLEKQVAEKQEQRKGLVAELEILAQEEAQEAAKQAAIAALQEETAAMTKKIAEAQAKILELSK